MNLAVRAIDLVGRFFAVDVALVSILAHKSPSYKSMSHFLLVLGFSRSMLEWVWLGDTLCLLDTMDLLSLRLSTSVLDSACFPFLLPRGGSSYFLDLTMDVPFLAPGVGFISLLDTIFCVNSSY